MQFSKSMDNASYFLYLTDGMPAYIDDGLPKRPPHASVMKQNRAVVALSGKPEASYGRRLSQHMIHAKWPTALGCA